MFKNTTVPIYSRFRSCWAGAEMANSGSSFTVVQTSFRFSSRSVCGQCLGSVPNPKDRIIQICIQRVFLTPANFVKMCVFSGNWWFQLRIAVVAKLTFSVFSGRCVRCPGVHRSGVKGGTAACSPWQSTTGSGEDQQLKGGTAAYSPWLSTTGSGEDHQL